MVLQEAVLATEVAVAESTVANNALSSILALLEGATNLLLRHDEWWFWGEDGLFKVVFARGRRWLSL